MYRWGSQTTYLLRSDRISQWSEVFSSQFLSSCAFQESSDDEGSDTEAGNPTRPFEPAFEIVGNSTVSTDQERQQWGFPIKVYCVSLRNKFHYIF